MIRQLPTVARRLRYTFVFVPGVTFLRVIKNVEIHET